MAREWVDPPYEEWTGSDEQIREANEEWAIIEEELQQEEEEGR